ncbi:sugar nucleotidyltransferase [Bacteroides sp.]
MKGIVLSGDSGSRLFPLTLGIPKQLLPVYDKPMIYYPIETLVQAGVNDILVITTSCQQSAFHAYLQDGSALNCNISYAVQDEPRGIAEALIISKEFIANKAVCLITGDTIISGTSLPQQLHKAFKAVEKSGNATIFVSKDQDGDQYGKVTFNRTIVGDSDERNYKSMTGLYVFPKSVIKKVEQITPSERGLLEITSVCQLYQAESKLQIQELSQDCHWLDTNTFDNLVKCNTIMQQRSKQSLL